MSDGHIKRRGFVKTIKREITHPHFITDTDISVTIIKLVN